MYLDKQLPPLRGEGFCPECNAWIDLGMDDWLPRHTRMVTGEECSQMNHAPTERRFVIESRAEAEQVGAFLLAQKGQCLFSDDGHSPSCGNGRQCEHLTRRYYQALVRYGSGETKSCGAFRCDAPELSTEGRCSHCSEWYLLSDEDESALIERVCVHTMHPVKETRLTILTLNEAYAVSIFLTNRHGDCEARKKGVEPPECNGRRNCSEFLRLYGDALARFMLTYPFRVQDV